MTVRVGKSDHLREFKRAFKERRKERRVTTDAQGGSQAVKIDQVRGGEPLKMTNVKLGHENPPGLLVRL